MENKSLKYHVLENLVSYVFVPTLLLTIYCGFLGIIYNHFHLVGVNTMFIFRMIKFLIYVIPVEFGLIIALIFIKFKKQKKIILIKQNKQEIFKSDLLLLLLPITPVIQYIVINIEIFSLHNVLIVLMFFLIFSGLLSLVIPYLLAIIGNYRVLIALGLSFSFTIILMPYLSQIFNWFQSGNLFIQLLCFLSFSY